MRNIRWIAIVSALVFAAVVGNVAYNAGVTHGIEQSGKLVVAAPGTPPPYPYPYPYYGGYRPWGFGFLGPFVFIAFWILIARGIFGHRHGWYHHHRGSSCGYRDDPADGAATK